MKKSEVKFSSMSFLTSKSTNNEGYFIGTSVVKHDVNRSNCSVSL